MTTVAIDDTILTELLQFAQGEEGVRVLANKKWRGEVERLLRYDIQTLSLVAGFLIALMVIYQFRNTRAVVAVLAPVISSLAAMSIFCFLTGGQLNMMHLIMGLMVIGVSVDYGIFSVCAKLAGQEKISERSVSLTAASSLIGFGVLAFAGHPALHALGVTVLIGIGVAWPTALLVSPALLMFGKKE
jgi:predicted exporter